jgi:RNA polymerase sigma-70 factor (ECF subfamily)
MSAIMPASQFDVPPTGITMKVTDGSLVRETLSGNCSAFDELVGRYQRQAIGVAYRLLGNAHDAVEVAQDAFLKAFTNLAMLQKAEAFGGWLMRIVSNLSLNFRRSRKTRATLPLESAGASEGAKEIEFTVEPADVANDPARRVQSFELGSQLRAAMMQLTETQRTAIMLFTIEQMPQKDVAEKLGCSVEAVKWHVFQGRKRLKEILKDYLVN